MEKEVELVSLGRVQFVFTFPQYPALLQVPLAHIIVRLPIGK